MEFCIEEEAAPINVQEPAQSAEAHPGLPWLSFSPIRQLINGFLRKSIALDLTLTKLDENIQELSQASISRDLPHFLKKIQLAVGRARRFSDATTAEAEFDFILSSERSRVQQRREIIQERLLDNDTTFLTKLDRLLAAANITRRPSSSSWIAEDRNFFDQHLRLLRDPIAIGFEANRIRNEEATRRKLDLARKQKAKDDTVVEMTRVQMKRFISQQVKFTLQSRGRSTSSLMPKNEHRQTSPSRRTVDKKQAKTSKKRNVQKKTSLKKVSRKGQKSHVQFA